MSPRRAILGLFVLMTLLYCALGTYRDRRYKVDSDGKYYYQYLLSFVMDGDLDFTDDYRVARYPWMEEEIDHYHFRDLVAPSTGRPANLLSCGPAVLWLPFFVVALAIGALLDLLPFVTIVADGWSRFHQYTVMFAAVVYTTLGLWLTLLLARRWFGRRDAALAVAATLVVSNLLYYATVEVSMSHAYEFFTLAWYLYGYACCFDRPTPGRLAVCGFAGGLHVLVRPHELPVFAMLSALLAVALWRRQPRASVGPALSSYVVAAALILAPWPLSNLYLYGDAFTLPAGSGWLHWSHPHALDVLFSQRNGLFSHHPLLLVGLVGFGLLLARALRSADPPNLLLVGLAVAFAMQLYLSSIIEDWWGGHAFGQRRLVSALPLFALGFAECSRRLRRRFVRAAPRWVVPLAVVVVGAHLYLMLIHVFLWDYDQPHDILEWLFYEAPRRIWTRLV